jgi:DNA end-binding protein Ku
VRAAEFPSLDEDVTIKPAELKMAGMLVESFAGNFQPEDYTDEYRVELEQLIEAKLEGGEAFPAQEPKEEGEDAEVVDLLAALQRSVERHKDSGEDSKASSDSRSDSKSGGSRSSGTRSGGTRSSSARSTGSRSSGTRKTSGGKADAEKSTGT